MFSIAFSFAEFKGIIYVEILEFSFANGNLEEQLCKFFLYEEEIQYIHTLNEFYKLSLLLTENNKELLFNDIENTWEIRSRKHRVKKCFTEHYYKHYGFSEHPSVKFDKIFKRKKSILKYNQYSINYYKEIYEKAFQFQNYLDMYYNYEIRKIEKELDLIQEDVHKEIMRSNLDIIGKVLPDDIIAKIKEILVISH